MGMSTRLKWFLDSRGIRYEVVPHMHTSTSRETARVAHVPADRLAKSVILEDERGYVMAIVPASCRVSLEALEVELGGGAVDGAGTTVDCAGLVGVAVVFFPDISVVSLAMPKSLLTKVGLE